ncbi:ABC transporter substrate-binding protein [Cytobacillus depressus]|uniref:ABC transporter substrate-binding protein n=1 Tax=Cytobacillus depressus TaxID=1602942 RepID=A0A6L3V0D1_9BACI|nr:ABC transporter substrate-binding protein [Cytobacillus depressus]KAB2330498.1 ABC transporter substrate-binding protein [Cytobacillus depressus]
MRKFTRNWFILIVCILLLSACSSGAINTATKSDDKGKKENDSADQTIKIGALLPATGVYASLGENVNNGMELYFEEHNWEVAGKKIEIVHEDSEADPQVSLRKLRKMIEQDKIDILTGPISTAVAYAIRDDVDKNKLPFLVSHAGGNDLTRSKRSDYIWRSSFSSWQIGHSMGQWAFNNVGKKIYLTAADYAFGHEVVEAFKEAYTNAGGEIVDEVYPPLGNNDYSSYLGKMNRDDIDGIYAFFAGSDAVRFVQQYEQYGLKGKIPLIGSGWLVAEDVRPQQGNAPEGIKSSIFWDYSLETEENKKFVEAYEKKFNKRPSIESLEGYDAAAIMAKAIESLNGDVSDPTKIVEQISSVELISPRGLIKFDKDTHHVIQDLYIVETVVVDGSTENKVIDTISQVVDPGK